MRRRRRKRRCRYRRMRCKTIVRIKIKRICKTRRGRRWSPIVAAAVLQGTPASTRAQDVINTVLAGGNPGRGRGPR